MEWAATYLWIWTAVQLTQTVVMLIGASRFLRACSQQAGNPSLPDVLIPAFNERRHLLEIKANLAAARNVGLAAYVVDDGSTDGSGTELVAATRDAQAVLIRHTTNCGKAPALQTAIGATAAHMLMTIDADTTLGFAEFGKVVNTPISPGIGAIAFRIDVMHLGEFLNAAQAAEYAYVLNFERAALAGFGFVLTVPGAAALWRRDALLAIGGFSSRTLAEDTDATLQLQMHGWRIVVLEHICAQTLCPATVKTLIRQRARWIWGNLQAAFFAGVAAIADKGVIRRTPALTMFALSAINLLGQAVVTLTLVRILFLDLGLSDFWASAALLLGTLFRILAVRQVFGYSGPSICSTLLGLVLMQALNFCGFWTGLLRGLPLRRSWR